MTLQLQIADGPPCPKCGCQAGRQVATSGSHPVIECDHCGKRFVPEPPPPEQNGFPVVQRLVTRCPECDGTKHRVYGHTRNGRGQYHLCECGARFISQE